MKIRLNMYNNKSVVIEDKFLIFQLYIGWDGINNLEPSYIKIVGVDEI